MIQKLNITTYLVVLILFGCTLFSASSVSAQTFEAHFYKTDDYNAVFVKEFKRCKSIKNNSTTRLKNCYQGAVNDLNGTRYKKYRISHAVDEHGHEQCSHQRDTMKKAKDCYAKAARKIYDGIGQEWKDSKIPTDHTYTFRVARFGFKISIIMHPQQALALMFTALILIKATRGSFLN